MPNTRLSIPQGTQAVKQNIGGVSSFFGGELSQC